MMAKPRKRRNGLGRPVPGAGASVTVRHFCQGIGDCHLLTFTRDDGKPFYMLIDCGVHSSVPGGTSKIADIVKDLSNITKRIDVLVVTHEHWDHVSGFLTAAADLRKLTFGEIWMGWTEDPDDPQARELDKFKGQAIDAVQGAKNRLDAMNAVSPHLERVRLGLEAVLGFNFGLKGEKVRAARDAAIRLNPRGVRYLEPSSDVLALPGVGSMRVYVLGPPRDAKLLGITDRASEMYGLAAGGGWPMAVALDAAFRAEADSTGDADLLTAPFEPVVGSKLSDALKAAAGNTGKAADGTAQAIVGSTYVGTGSKDSWRRIDGDWLGLSADLAMQLDKRTNNTSLALAFEFVETGRVLLFAADAQIGSWLSWQNLKWGDGPEAVTGPDLLARTVYYKVGHHGSQNATARSKGLETMTSPDLAAFIPTNEVDAKRVGWGEMPYHGIVADLGTRTRNRFVRADDPWLKGPKIDPRFSKPTGCLRATSYDTVKGRGLWVEFEIA